MCRMLLVAMGLVLGNLAFASLPSLPLSAQEPNPRADPQVHEGMVVSASGNQVSLKGADGKEKSFKTNEKTRIIVNGKPGKLENLKPGVMIRVMVDGNGMVTSVSTVDDRKGF
jgi:hypothetical protein